MSTFGADIDELRQLAKTFSQKADILETDVLSSVTQGVSTSAWQGADADQFRNAWGSALAPKIRNVVADLREQSARLERNAQQQEQASGVDGGASGGGFGPGSSDRSNIPGLIKQFLQDAKEVVDVVKENVEDLKDLVDEADEIARWVLANPDMMKRARDLAEKFGAEKAVDFITEGAEGVAKYAPKASKFLGNVADKLGLVGDVLDFGITAVEKYQTLESSNPEMSAGERVLTAGVHTGVKTAVEFAGGRAGAWAGAAIGGAVGGPIGAVIGGGIGYLVGSGVASYASDYIADAVTSVAAPVLDVAGDAITDFFTGITGK